MTNTNPVDAAIEAAKQAAAANPVVAQTVNTEVAVSNVSRTPSPIKLATAQRSRMIVDSYVKFDKYGIEFNKIKPGVLINSFKGSLVVNEITGFYGVTWGKPVVYAKSYDGVKTPEGDLWEAVLAKAKMISPDNVKEYVGFDLPIRIEETIKAPDGSVILEAGTTVGYSSTKGTYEAIIALKEQAELQGLLDKRVVFTVTSYGIKTKAGSEYGCPKFLVTGSTEK